MDKIILKNILREYVQEFSILDEKKKSKAKKNKSKPQKKTDDLERNVDGLKKDYSDVQRAFQKLGGPSMVDIMILALDLPDDKSGVNRSLFRKKVKQVKNRETGSIYQFDDNELTKVRTALGIKK